MDLSVSADGDTDVGLHHTVEDVGIVLGRVLQEAVGEAAGITRMAHAYVPLDEALALSVVDFGGRGYAVIDLPLTDSDLGGLSADLLRHFLDTLARARAGSTFTSACCPARTTTTARRRHSRALPGRSGPR